MKMPAEAFDAYLSKCPPAMQTELRAIAVRTEDEVEFPGDEFRRLLDKHYPWQRRQTRRRLGLGDVVAAVAQPIASAVDAVAGTNLKGCGGCQQRRDALNRAVPDVRNPLG